jgi:hypothetical protein
MPGNFEILRPPKPPFWRDPKHRPKEVGLERFVFVSVSLVCGGLMFLPSRLGFLAPISLELAEGSIGSWALFGLLGIALAYLTVKFGKVGRYFSSVFCLLAIGGLSVIAFTDPFSFGHTMTFGTLSLLVPIWLWGLQMDIEDPKLAASATGCTLAFIGCGFNLGIGERLMLVSALCGLNVVFYEHVLV